MCRGAGSPNELRWTSVWAILQDRQVHENMKMLAVQELVDPRPSFSNRMDKVRSGHSLLLENLYQQLCADLIQLPDCRLQSRSIFIRGGVQEFLE
jgi:hypothetical protein